MTDPSATQHSFRPPDFRKRRHHDRTPDPTPHVTAPTSPHGSTLLPPSGTAAAGPAAPPAPGPAAGRLPEAGCGGFSSAQRPNRDGREPGLWLLLAATAGLYLWNLSASGYANDFYAAAVKAGTESWKAVAVRVARLEQRDHG